MKNTILSWRENKIRWVLLFYVLGTIIGCYSMFFYELTFDTPTMARFKVLSVTVLIPLMTIVISSLIAAARLKLKNR
ncbi:MAG: hypothetical protein P9M14_14935 [Candidatus Alcyoniella australis]|nr:hypothetical protein [Candidatus Alcyoniella australis]